MTQWIFLRHGESTANAAGVLSGWTDVPLTPTGEAQAIAAGRGLADVALHQVLTTDLQRARRTAELALAQWAATTGQPAPRLEVDGRLRERNMGRWRGKSYKKLRASGLTETMMAWDGRPPGGESNADLARRIVAALADYEEQVTAGPVLLVAHGGVIRTLLGLTDGVPRADIARQSIANAVPLTRDLAAGHWSTLFSLL